MYKQPNRVQKVNVRNSWLVINSEDSPTTTCARQSDAPEIRSRASDPITIFSADNANASNQVSAILPQHDGDGLFRGCTQNDQTACDLRSTDQIDSETESSLSSVLEEVLDSVDAAHEVCQRQRANSRIEAWLGHQSHLQSPKVATTGTEETRSTKSTCHRVIQKLLGIDDEFLNKLLGTDTTNRTERQKDIDRQIEQRMLKRFIHLARHDTLLLRRGMLGQDQRVESQRTTAPRSKRSLEEIKTKILERIPWGIPDDGRDDAYWNEELSIPMLYRYIKSYLQPKTDEKPAETEEQSDIKQARLATSASTQTEAGTLTRKTLSTVAASRYNAKTTYIAQPRTLRSSQRSTRHANHSSSLRSNSARTATTCSIASLRHSGLGGHFWDIGSLGGASAQGNWSIHA